MERFRHHGDKIVWRVTDCNARRQDASAVDVGQLRALEKRALDEILELLERRPRSVAQDNRAQYNALAELNRKNAEFWSRQ